MRKYYERVLLLLHVRLSGRNLFRVDATAKAKGMSMCDAANYLIECGWKALDKGGDRVRPDKDLPIVWFRRHDQSLDERLAAMSRAEKETGRSVIMVGVIDTRTSFGMESKRRPTTDDGLAVEFMNHRYAPQHKLQGMSDATLMMKGELCSEEGMKRSGHRRKERKRAEDARIRELLQWPFGPKKP